MTLRRASLGLSRRHLNGILSTIVFGRRLVTLPQALRAASDYTPGGRACGPSVAVTATLPTTGRHSFVLLRGTSVL